MFITIGKKEYNVKVGAYYIGQKPTLYWAEAYEDGRVIANAFALRSLSPHIVNGKIVEEDNPVKAEGRRKALERLKKALGTKQSSLPIQTLRAASVLVELELYQPEDMIDYMMHPLEGEELNQLLPSQFRFKSCFNPSFSFFEYSKVLAAKRKKSQEETITKS